MSGRPEEAVFLDLLAKEAEVAEFEAVLDRARGEGREAEELEALRDAMVTALQIRAVLDERRRRERELAALYETAGDLTSLRDVQRVLQAIVRRARQLLGTDTAYLMLIDEPNQEAYMRVTEGTVTADFEHVRMDLGAGLGGLVAETASPYATHDYATDERFAHTREVDDAVSREGLRAILGVPLMLGEDVIGVLCAANRLVRPFTSHEVSLLSSLGAHAAVAIENARLFTETATALRELGETTAMVERAAAAHERLTALVVEGGDLLAVVGAVAEVLDGRLLLVGIDGEVLASGGPAGDPLHDAAVVQGSIPRASPAGAQLRSALPQAVESATATRVDVDGAGERWLAPVLGRADEMGCLVLGSQTALGAAEVRTLERAAVVCAVVLLHERAVAEAERRVRGELLDDLLTRPHADPDRIRTRARLIGVDLDRSFAVVVATVPADGRAALSAAGALARDFHGIAGVHQGRLVLLLDGHSPSEAAALACKRLSAHVEELVTAGAAGPAVGPEAIAEAHQQAQRCLRVLLALGRVGQASSVDELGLFAMLLGSAGRDDVDGLVRRTLGPVLDYDERRGTELVETLEMYFRESGNATRAAEGLHIHVNTLYQRLDRIGRLLGADWTSEDRALQIHLALRFARVRTALS